MFSRIAEISGHAGAIYSVDFDGEFIYTGSADRFVARWNLQSRTQDSFTVQLDQAAYAVKIVEKRYLVIGQSDGGIHVIDIAERKELRHFVQHKSAIFSIQWNAVNHQMYIGDADGNVSIWDTRSFSLLLLLPFDAGKIRRIVLNQDGTQIALACQDGTLRILELRHFNEILTLDAHDAGTTSGLFLSNEQFVSGGKDGHLRLWDTTNGSCLKAIPAHHFAIYDILRIDKFLVTASRDKTLKTWTDSVEFCQRLDVKEGGHRHSVNALVNCGDKRFASVSDDKRILIWEKS